MRSVAAVMGICLSFLVVMITALGTTWALMAIVDDGLRYRVESEWVFVTFALVLLVLLRILTAVLRAKGDGNVGRLTEAVRDRPMDKDEARLMQEIHDGFTRMEERVESLETILLDRARPRTRPPSFTQRR